MASLWEIKVWKYILLTLKRSTYWWQWCSASESRILAENVGRPRSEHEKRVDDSTLGEPVRVDLRHFVTFNEVHQLRKHVLRQTNEQTRLAATSSQNSLIEFYPYLLNTQMKWLLYIRHKRNVYLLSCMDVKSRHWLITVCIQSALHGTIVFGKFVTVVGMRALNLFSFSVKQCQLHIYRSAKNYFSGNKLTSLKVVCKGPWHIWNMCNALCSKYGLCPYDGTDAIKYAVFENFSAALVMWFYVFICLPVGYMYIFCLCICFFMLPLWCNKR